ncbi:MAG: hypothetical protein ACP5R4_01965 [Armatimonadota bacterium]
MRTAIIGFCVLAGALGLQGTTKTPPSEWQKPLRPKVLVIIFNPIIESEGGKRLVEVCRWNDPRKLLREYINDISEVSGGFVQYQVSKIIEVDEFPVKKDGFRYTDQSYMECFRSGKGWHQPDAVDYEAIIKKFNIVRRVENGEIDEVWLFGMPYAGFWESTMAGNGAYFCNSDPVPNIRCSKIFVIMGFNYERGVGEMLEDLGHRAESILTRVFGSWEPKETHAWNRFTLYDKVAPGRAACGNIHFAPNSERDYDWGNTKHVWSTCDDWLNYPNLTGKRRLVNCSEWGSGDIREHHKWWFRHLPKAPGRTDGKLNNWWCYIVDFNRYPESR